MNKIATRVHALMILLLVVFGNDMLKFTINRVSNLPLVLYFCICFFHIIVSYRNNKFKLIDTEKKVLRYLIWMFAVICLSILGIYRLFLSNILAFDKSFIVKQTLFFFLIPIAISMYICFIHDREHIEKLLNKFSLTMLLLLFILSFRGYCSHTISYFFILIISFYNVKEKKLFTKIITIAITVLFLRNMASSTGLLMLIIYLIMLVFNTKMITFIQRKRKLLYLAICVLLVYALFNYNSILLLLERIDINSWWRFTYWSNEFRILKKTLFMGVGYGSTYATVDIFNTLKGGFIDPLTGNTINTVSALFTTGQHNSYMNVLYRTGIVGLIFFLIYTFDLMFKSKKYIKNKFDSMAFMAFINANIIIIFNVGLESPQFILAYYFGLAALLSLRRVNN